MRKVLFSLVLVLMGFVGMGQGIIASWSFEGVTVSNVAGQTPSVTGGSTTADAGSLTAGSAFSAFHASTSTVYSTPAGNGSTKSLSSNNWAVGDYYQFKVATTGFTGIKLSWDQNGSSTGPAPFKVQYSTTPGGTTGYNDFSTYTIPNNGATPTPAAYNWATSSINLITKFTANLSSITALENLPEVYFRLVCTGTTAIATTFGTAGTGRVDNFIVSFDSPLPITLISFKASLNSSNQAVLKWATASEKDNHYFEIERSKNAIDFESLGKMNGKGTSDLRNDYAFTDETPLKGINYYRLKQVDFDGTFSYTRPESVITEGDGSISLYPNPTVNVLKINFEDLDQIETATIYNQSGVLMKNLQGSKSSIDIQELPQGKYILQIRLADQRIITNSFVKF
jgi:hypothetical protein